MARRLRTESMPFGSFEQRLESMKRVADRQKEWKPAPEGLKKLEAVPSIFPQFNVASRVGGIPTQCVIVVHGQSGEGKTTATMGFSKSYIEKNHFSLLVDAERTTTIDWAESMYGPELVNHPGFSILPVSTYEDATDGIKNYLEDIANAREKGELPEDIRALVTVDSIRKLMPKNILKTLFDKGADEGQYSKGIDGYGGRAGQAKAHINSSWMDWLTPIVNDYKATIVLITRESPNPTADKMKGEDDFFVLGGSGMVFEASLRLRIRKKYLKLKDDEIKDGIIGEKHEIQIHKTKVGDKKVRIPKAFFYTSNGRLSPYGFDRARDVFDLARSYNVIELNGAWYSTNGQKIGQGELKALDWLREGTNLQDVEALAVSLAESDMSKGRNLNEDAPEEEDWEKDGS